MKIALLSDIHGNQQALQACLADAAHQGVDRYAFLGDLAGYGADPHRVIETVQEYVARGAVAVRGNHDQACYGDASYLNEMARTAIDYGKTVLQAAHLEFLKSLPLIIRDATCCFVHASAASPQKYPYVDSPAAAQQCAVAAELPHTFCGHVHEQRLYFAAQPGQMRLFRPTAGIAVPLPAHRQWVSLIGSVGQPRDNNPSAAYALFDSARPSITFCRVPYDHRAAAARIREVGLPESIAMRVESGY